MDANTPSTHPCEGRAHASVLRFYASDSIFTNADCGLFKLEMRFNSFHSFVLTSDSIIFIHYFPNWNEPIQAEEPQVEEIISLLSVIATTAM